MANEMPRINLFSDCEIKGRLTMLRHIIFTAVSTCALVLALSQTTSAQDLLVNRIEIVEKGIFHSEVTKRTDSNTPAGFTDTVANAALVTSSTTVPARAGTEFGIRFRVVGSPSNAKVTLKKIWKFPKDGLRNPQTHETHFLEETTQVALIGNAVYAGYGFDLDWEAVPGLWTIELWYQGRKLAEQSFTVVRE